MKKKILIALFFITLTGIGKAQNLISKVPENVAMVVKYAAENFTRNTTLQKLDSYNFVKKDLFKMLHMDSLTSLKNLGINFEQDIYQYLTMQDTSLTFVTLLKLSNTEQFLNAIKSHYNSAGKLEKKNGFNFYSAEAETYFGWNNEIGIIVNTSYQNKKSYWDYLYKDDTLVRTAVVEVAPADVADMVQTIEEPPSKTQKGKKPAAKPKTNTAKIQALKKAQRLKKEREAFVRDSIESVKRELWYQQQEMIAKKYQYGIAEKTINTVINGTVSSIQNEIKYAKIIEPAAHLSVWLNNETLMSQYNNFFMLGRYYGIGNYNRPSFNRMDTSASFNSAINMYFEKDKMRMEQKSFSTDADLTKLGNAVMDSKQSASLLNYINTDNFGYLSMSVNTEAMVNYYYSILKKYFNYYVSGSESIDAGNLFIDFLQILIDEKAIADLTPGNYLFVLHDMKNRLVSYTDYQYDKEFNKKEIKKTKNELSPNFTFVMETRKEAFMERLMNMPLKYAKKEGWNYTAKNGYNELIFKEGEFPISGLYFMVKDGKGIITTNKEVIDNTLSNKGFTIDEEAKNFILQHNYALKIDTKKILEKLGPEFSTSVGKKINDYLLQNFGDVTMESSLKNGIIQGTTIMNIKGEHTNSFEFLFEMMDAINTIMEKERLEDEKKNN